MNAPAPRRTISVLGALRAALPGIDVATLHTIPREMRECLAREMAASWGCRLACDVLRAQSSAPLDAPAALRVVALWLGEFCDGRRSYPEMVAEAARRAATTIDILRMRASGDAGRSRDERAGRAP